jgi:hypothetical protein
MVSAIVERFSRRLVFGHVAVIISRDTARLVAVDAFRFHPEIIKFDRLKDRRIELAAHVEHAIYRLMRVREKIGFGRKSDAITTGDRRGNSLRRSSASRF